MGKRWERLQQSELTVGFTASETDHNQAPNEIYLPCVYQMDPAVS